MFRSSTILRELVQSLAKIILLLKYSVKLRPCILCGEVAACREMACVLFVVQTAVWKEKQHYFVAIKPYRRRPGVTQRRNVAFTCKTWRGWGLQRITTVFSASHYCFMPAHTRYASLLRSILVYTNRKYAVKLLTLLYVSRECILITSIQRVRGTDKARAILLSHKDIRITAINTFWYASNKWRYAYGLSFLLSIAGVRGGAVGWGIALRVRTTRFRFSIESLGYFTYVILPAALGSTKQLTGKNTRVISWE